VLAGAKLKINVVGFAFSVIACVHMVLVGSALDKSLPGLLVSEAGRRFSETWCCISSSIFHVNISA